MHQVDMSVQVAPNSDKGMEFGAKQELPGVRNLVPAGPAQACLEATGAFGQQTSSGRQGRVQEPTIVRPMARYASSKEAFDHGRREEIVEWILRPQVCHDGWHALQNADAFGVGAYVRINTYMHICMHAYTYTYKHTSYLSIYPSIHPSIHLSNYLSIHVSIYHLSVCVSARLSLYVHACAYVRLFRYVHLYVHGFACVYIHTYIYICMYVCMCVYM